MQKGTHPDNPSNTSMLPENDLFRTDCPFHNDLFATAYRDRSNNLFSPDTANPYRHFFMEIPAAFLISSQYGHILESNPAARELLGLPGQPSARTLLTDYLHESGRPSFLTFLAHLNTPKSPLVWTGTAEKNGKKLRIKGISGSRRRIYLAIDDMTEEGNRNSLPEERARYMVEHDFLTGLPNRMLLMDRLGQTIMAAERKQRKAAVMFLDLDRFKHINDTLGHAAGDSLLQQVAGRLGKCVRKNDTVSRQGGDEFVILLNDIGHADDAARVAGNIMHALSQNCRIDHFETLVTPSIGIAMYPDDGTDIDTLLKNADTAMYHAKESGRNAYRFFNADMNRHLVERTQLVNDLRSALENGSFFLEYQPIIDTNSGRMNGAEAFLRWTHPEFGTLLPARFLEVAEDTGLIGPIGEWVIRSACRQAGKWHKEGRTGTISINLSPIQLKHRALLSSVRNALEENGLPPCMLELQITEGCITENIRTVSDQLCELRDMGIHIALDNFGSGSSGIGHLKKAPIGKIKISPVFIHALGTDSKDAGIAAAIVAMAKSLRLKVSAGCVETASQALILKEIGCDEYQGNLLSPSLPASEISRFHWHDRQAD